MVKPNNGSIEKLLLDYESAIAAIRKKPTSEAHQTIVDVMPEIEKQLEILKSANDPRYTSCFDKYILLVNNSNALARERESTDVMYR